MESKQNTPSVIARLMGLDELLPKQPLCKPHQVLSENYLRKSASVGLIEKRSFHESRSFRVTNGKGREFMDVFELPEMPTMDKHFIQPIQEGKANTSMAEAKMSSISQKFTDANHLSMDQKLHHSQEFDNALEEPHSNEDFLLRYHQQPDSLFTRYPDDLQFSQPHSQSGYAIILNSSKSPCSRKNKISQKSERTNARPNILRSPQELENGFCPGSHDDLGIDYTFQLTKSRLKLKDDSCFFHSRTVKDDTYHSASRIVVLKANIGKAQTASRPSFSPISGEGSLSSERNHAEFSTLKNGELNNPVVERTNFVMKPSRNSFRVSGEFEGISRTKMLRISTRLREVSRTELKVGETSANESEVMMPSCPSFFDLKNQYRTSYSPSNRSSFTKKAKKQLSERGKTVTSLQEVGVAGRRTSLTTPGEMLAMSDQETRPRNLNCDLNKIGLKSQLSLNDGDADLSSPFCISSSDGRKEECARSLTKSGSLPAACITVEIPKSGTSNKAVSNGFCFKLEESSVTHKKNESRKQSCSQKDSSEARASSFTNVKAHVFSCMDSGISHYRKETCVILDDLENKVEKEVFSGKSFANCKLPKSSIPHSDLENDRTVQETQVIQDELENNSFGENNLSRNCGKNSMFPNSPISSVASLSLNSEVAAVAETENMGMYFGTPKKQQSEPVACISFVKDGHSSHALNASTGKESLNRSQEELLVPSSCPRNDPEFPISLEECHSPSPNSVLKPHFHEEFSFGSECFQGVRMKLQFLKSDSEETISQESGMAVSSDEDTGDGSVDLSEENIKLFRLFRAEESRDFSYIIDVLDEAGFHYSYKQPGFEKWQPAGCPVSPSVFEMLEKKYGEQTSWKKSERRLLFDHVNAGLKEILQPCTYVLAWENPLRKRFSLWLSREVVEEELWLLLCNQAKEVGKNLSEKAVGTEMRWFELRDDIDFIVSELEKFLLDELVAELVSIEN